VRAYGAVNDRGVGQGTLPQAFWHLAFKHFTASSHAAGLDGLPSGGHCMALQTGASLRRVLESQVWYGHDCGQARELAMQQPFSSVTVSPMQSLSAEQARGSGAVEST
jgi:hypothetical protein